MDEFRVDHFMKSFEIFLEELSNWYVRRNEEDFGNLKMIKISIQLMQVCIMF